MSKLCPTSPRQHGDCGPWIPSQKTGNVAPLRDCYEGKKEVAGAELRVRDQVSIR